MREPITFIEKIINAIIYVCKACKCRIDDIRQNFFFKLFKWITIITIIYYFLFGTLAIGSMYWPVILDLLPGETSAPSLMIQNKEKDPLSRSTILSMCNSTVFTKQIIPFLFLGSTLSYKFLIWYHIYFIFPLMGMRGEPNSRYKKYLLIPVIFVHLSIVILYMFMWWSDVNNGWFIRSPYYKPCINFFKDYLFPLFDFYTLLMNWLTFYYYDAFMDYLQLNDYGHKISCFVYYFYSTFKFLIQILYIIIWTLPKIILNWGPPTESIEIKEILTSSAINFSIYNNIYFMSFFFFFYKLLMSEVWIILIKSLLLVIPILISVAFLTLVERKSLSTLQRRKGPNKLGFWGLLQAFADGLKLIVKEPVVPGVANKFLFKIAPICSFMVSLLVWAPLPIFSNHLFMDINLGILYIIGMSSIGVYGIIIAGWASNSKYSFLGACRSAAQMISYEISMGILILTAASCSGSLKLGEIVSYQQDIWFTVPLFMVSGLFFICSLAETNRPPFDLPEAEAELVSGYSTEYSATSFALFFIAEYGNIIFLCSLQVILFWGGWLPPHFFGLLPINLNYINPFIWFALKLGFLVFVFIWVRASLPRFRYDQLMRLGWKVILPLSLLLLLTTNIFLYILNLLP